MDKISSSVEQVSEPCGPDDMPPGSNFYRVELHYKGRTMNTPFASGPGNKRAPKTWEVVYCLVSDATSYLKSNGFEDWAAEYDYDTDSRRIEELYHTVGRQTDALVELLGSESMVWLLCDDGEDSIRLWCV